MAAPSAVLAYLAEHRAEHLEELAAFLRIPSISSLPEHRDDVRRAAVWLADRLHQAGISSARVEETAGHPVVIGHYDSDPEAPTVLVYGHFDVQPVDPLDSWQHPPFEPVIRDDVLYARGASDDKGQVFMQLIAIEAWIKTVGRLPVNLRLLFEGEEEIGSVHLASFITEHAAQLGADFAVISDTPMFDQDVPAICYGLRGLASLEVTVSGPFQDLHSGVYGGTVANPAHALAHLIDSLHDKDGGIAISGFYDGADALTPRERDAFAALPFDEDAFRRALQVDQLFGEPTFSVLERTWARPTIEVNGMWSGFIGAGRKTIIPHQAHAKITCRLVPHQDPEAVLQAVTAHLYRHCPSGVRLRVEPGEASPATLTPLDHAAVSAAASAIHQVFNRDPQYIRMGGSIPVVVTLQEILKMPTILLGFALPNENFHAPNEHFHLANFHRGASTLAVFWNNVGTPSTSIH